MRITKKQLGRLIREALIAEAGDPNLPRADQPIEMVDEIEFGDWDMGPNVTKDPDRPWGSYADKDSGKYWDVIVMSPNGDSVLVDGRETYIQDVPSQIQATSGIEMSDVDADNLIFALETQEQDGYIELGVEYKDGKWSW
tara:strand:- start:46 stop:465 length:420 start_codon:yes stop_codon:yes gene_type:complete